MQTAVGAHYETDMATSINILWGPLRPLLKDNFTFREIKTLVGVSGVDLAKLSHIQQSINGAAKIDLIEGIDSIYESMDDEEKRRFLISLTEEVLQRKTNLADQVDNCFSRLGWTFVNGRFLQLDLLDASELQDLPATSHDDLLKAASRFRDGDLSGAISAVCGAVDSVTTKIYQTRGLGDPGSASFQEKVVRCLTALGVLTSIESDLISLGWDPADADRLKQNLRGSLNQAAYVMQTLRANMGDVHGTKPALYPLVFDSIKWATLILSLLKESQTPPAKPVA